MDRSDPHQGQPVRHAGAAVSDAKAAVIMLHGRGATAESILSLADLLGQPEIAYLAPQAAGHTWYAYSFLAPIEANEPWLSSALRKVDGLVRQVEDAGIPPERIALLGFSQGGCLALETAVRHPRRYGALIGLSAGLIGPDAKAWDHQGSLAGTPAFLGCSDIDPHIPLSRVRDSTAALRALGAEVTERI